MEQNKEKKVEESVITKHPYITLGVIAGAIILTVLSVNFGSWGGGYSKPDQTSQQNPMALKQFQAQQDKIIQENNATGTASQGKMATSSPTLPTAEELAQQQAKAKAQAVAKVQASAQAQADKEAFDNTPAGQLCIKYADDNWTKKDCTRVANGNYWIGMSDMMLFEERGNWDHYNISNYGNGEEYQYCWDNYIPSCFYENNQNVVTDYN